VGADATAADATAADATAADATAAAAEPAAPRPLGEPAAPASPRAPIEIVVDGTDGAGKTSFVSYLLEHCQRRGLRAASHAPYRECEVYPLWAHEPERAAQIVTATLARRRAESAHLDVLIWDRGWPTAYITTDAPRARAAFLPLPTVTVLLLGTTEMTRAKVRVHGARGEWVRDEALIQRYAAAYLALQAPGDHRLLRAVPDSAARFDFAELARALSRELDGAAQLRHNC
jgi:hypothetical protein